MLRISKCSGKLAGLKSLNTNPLTNSFCNRMAKNNKNICSVCYSRWFVNGVYNHTCYKPWENNAKILEKPLKDIPKINTIYFRFNAHGELINRINAINYYTIAEENPKVKFALWTKRVNLVKGLDKPDNLNLIFSTPQINCKRIKIPKGFDKVFSVYSKEYAENINCGAVSCFDCAICYKKNDIVFINETLRKGIKYAKFI